MGKSTLNFGRDLPIIESLIFIGQNILRSTPFLKGDEIYVHV